MKLLATIAAIIAHALTISADVKTGLSADVTTGPVWGYRTNDSNMLHSSKWVDNWKACGGISQSPINILTTGASKGTKLPLLFSGSCSKYSVTKSTGLLDVQAIESNCAVLVGNATYNMVQFHLHTPSEHALDGKIFDGEIHFVHSSSSGKALLVTGIFLKIGVTSDPWLSSMLDAFDTIGASEAIVLQLKSYATLVQKTSGIYNYSGSLTTPSCDEIVDWWVAETPITISPIDFNRLHVELMKYQITDNGNNARPAQALNGRLVRRYQ
ncbi:hypothetical protein CCR75_001069 [Bremia lactucae]|uniref:Carbonic anhydrase n=1 Tax=Bremia lactucae TaxID=4779 RepID=A0A976FSV1_BRELC|nr:hypothetical protein CCR75_001069 [Bremia lactucae]